MSSGEVLPVGTDMLWFDHLRPCHLQDRDLILLATQDIEMSFTGRTNMLKLNGFFVEASKELRNAVKLFEIGIYDAAFYSVRSAVELANIVAVLSGEAEPSSSDLYDEWKTGGWFPPDSKIRTRLSEICAPYQEVRQAIPDFFAQRKTELQHANKYIHRQGYKTFYTSDQRNRDRLDKMCNEFHLFIMGAVTEVILLRLSVDPFPLLLRDPEVMYKIHYISPTKPLSDVVVDEFLNSQLIDSYRSTQFYMQHAEEFLDNEPFSKVVYDLFNFGLYHHADHEKIMLQFNLLTKSDRTAVRIFECVADVSCIFSDFGRKMYVTDSFDFNKGFTIGSSDFRPDQGQLGIINRPSNQGYETLIHVDGDAYMLNHIHPFSADSIRSLEMLRSDADTKSN